MFLGFPKRLIAVLLMLSLAPNGASPSFLFSFPQFLAPPTLTDSVTFSLTAAQIKKARQLIETLDLLIPFLKSYRRKFGRDNSLEEENPITYSYAMARKSSRKTSPHEDVLIEALTDVSPTTSFFYALGIPALERLREDLRVALGGEDPQFLKRYVISCSPAMGIYRFSRLANPVSQRGIFGNLKLKIFYREGISPEALLEKIEIMGFDEKEDPLEAFRLVGPQAQQANEKVFLRFHPKLMEQRRVLRLKTTDAVILNKAIWDVIESLSRGGPQKQFLRAKTQMLVLAETYKNKYPEFWNLHQELVQAANSSEDMIGNLQQIKKCIEDSEIVLSVTEEGRINYFNLPALVRYPETSDPILMGVSQVELDIPALLEFIQEPAQILTHEILYRLSGKREEEPLFGAVELATMEAIAKLSPEVLRTQYVHESLAKILSLTRASVPFYQSDYDFCDYGLQIRIQILNIFQRVKPAWLQKAVAPYELPVSVAERLKMQALWQAPNWPANLSLRNPFHRRALFVFLKKNILEMREPFNETTASLAFLSFEEFEPIVEKVDTAEELFRAVPLHLGLKKALVQLRGLHRLVFKPNSWFPQSAVAFLAAVQRDQAALVLGEPEDPETDFTPFRWFLYLAKKFLSLSQIQEFWRGLVFQWLYKDGMEEIDELWEKTLLPLIKAQLLPSFPSIKEYNPEAAEGLARKAFVVARIEIEDMMKEQFQQRDSIKQFKDSYEQLRSVFLNQFLKAFKDNAILRDIDRQISLIDMMQQAAQTPAVTPAGNKEIVAGLDRNRWKKQIQFCFDLENYFQSLQKRDSGGDLFSKFFEEPPEGEPPLRSFVLKSIEAELRATLLFSSCCLAPVTEAGQILSEHLQQKERLTRALQILKLVQSHCEILGAQGSWAQFLMEGKAGQVTWEQDSNARLRDQVGESENDRSLTPALKFLYAFQKTGLQTVIETLEKALSGNPLPEKLTISYQGIGIDLKRWNRLFDLSLRKRLLYSVEVASYEIEHDDFVGTTYSLQDRKVVQEDFNLVPDEASQKMCVTQMEVNLNQLVEIFNALEQDQSRNVFFNLILLLEEAFTQEREYSLKKAFLEDGELKLRGANTIYVGEEEVRKSDLLIHFPSSIFAEPVVVSRLLRLFSFPSPRIPTTKTWEGSQRNEVFLPLYDEEVRDRVLEALMRHNPKWFEQALDFLTKPVLDRSGEEIDLFGETVAFLFASGWIDLLTRDQLLLEHLEHKAGEVQFAGEVKERLQQGRPYVGNDFPQKETYERLKRQAYFHRPLLRNEVARTVRRLQADEFKRLTYLMEKEGKDWPHILPKLAFKNLFQRLAASLWKDWTSSPRKPFGIVSRLFTLVFHREKASVLNFPLFTAAIHQLLWIAHHLKELSMIPPEEENSFWDNFKVSVEERRKELEGQPHINLDDSSFVNQMQPVASDFLHLLSQNTPPSPSAHPLVFHPYYQQFWADALEMASVEESL